MAAATDPQIQIARFAAAALGLQLGRDAMAAAVQAVATQGLGAAADQALALALAGLGADQRARAVIGHLGLEPRSVEPAQQLLQQLFEDTGPQAGRALLGVLDALAGATSETGYQQDGLRFDRRIDSALQHAAQGAGNVPFRVESQVTLTAADDKVFGNALDDVTASGTRLAIGSTWNAGDQLLVDALSLVQLRLVADGSGGPLVLPSLASVEQLTIESQAAPDAAVLHVDAAAMTDLQAIRLQASQVDVVFDAAPAGGQAALRDMQVQLVDTPAGGIDHAVNFVGLAYVPPVLSWIRLELMDTRAATSTDPADRARPLKDQPYNGFSFLLNGERVVLKDELPSDTANGSFNAAQTYDDLLHALQSLLGRADNLARWPALAQVTAALGPAFDAVDTVTGRHATGTSIVLSVPAASGLALQRGNYVADDGVPASAMYHTVMGDASDGYIGTPVGHIVLDHAGQGLGGGDLLLGGLMQGEAALVASATGITRFEITVERDSALGVIAASDGQLQDVVVRSGAGNGGLKVQGWDQVTSVVGGAPADGDSTGLPGIGAAHGAWGFTDLRLIDLSGLRGPASIDARLTTAGLQRYADTGAQFIGGSGDDHLAWLIDGNVATRFVRVDGGAGNDLIELSAPQQSVALVLGPGFGSDHVTGFDSDDRLDFGALGGRFAGRALEAVPGLHALPVIDGNIDRVAVGPAAVDAAAVAERFAEAFDDVDRTQVLLTTNGAQAQVWVVSDPAGAGNLSVTLAGSVLLDGQDWMALIPGNFG